MKSGKQIKENRMDRDRLQVVGTVLIIVGVSMWVVYAVGRYLMGWNVTDRQFLPYHLATIIPGMLLRYHRFFFGFVKKWILHRDNNNAN